MVVYRRLSRDSYIEVSQSLQGLNEQIRAGVRGILLKSAILFVLAALCMIFLGAWFVARPVQTLMAFARRIGEGDLSQRVVLAGHDELSELGATLNTMCERLAEARAQLAAEAAERVAAVQQLRHADRLKTLGQLAAGIAHELGTPLNVVSGHAKMIMSGDFGPDEVRESAGVIKDQIAHITAVIRQLLDFARPSRLVLAPVDVAELVKHTVKLLSHLAAERRVRIVFGEKLEELTARIDAGQIRQALMNLLFNAVQACKPSQAVRVSVRRASDLRPGASDRTGYAVVSVQDEGHGISRDDLPRIFEPFFTTKAAGEGSGLGLSVARGIIEEHGGFIEVDSAPGAGSCFSLYIPLLDNGVSS